MLAEIKPEWIRQWVEQGKAHHDWIAFPPGFVEAVPQIGSPCEFCGTPTQKVLITHSMGPYPKGLIVTTTEMPAYQCLGKVDPCASYEYQPVDISREGLLKMRTLLRELLQAEGDTRGVSNIDESLKNALSTSSQ